MRSPGNPQTRYYIVTKTLRREVAGPFNFFTEAEAWMRANDPEGKHYRIKWTTMPGPSSEVDSGHPVNRRN